VRADQVERGDYLVRARLDVVPALGVPRGPDVEHREPTIEQVYDTLAFAALEGDRGRLRAVHLDGKGSAGEHVDVHVIDDVLTVGRYSAALELFGELAVSVAGGEMGGPRDTRSYAGVPETDG